MSQLQRTVPVLFDLLLSVETYPQQLMLSVLREMIKKSSVPFRNDDKTLWSDQPVEADECVYKSLSYFPNLPRVRNRRSYEADKSTKEKICTKRGSGHPSLLPGIFTIFCQHGMMSFYPCNNLVLWLENLCAGTCYGFQVMRMHESPNTPFTVLYERFKEGMRNPSLMQ